MQAIKRFWGSAFPREFPTDLQELSETDSDIEIMINHDKSPVFVMKNHRNNQMSSEVMKNLHVKSPKTRKMFNLT